MSAAGRAGLGSRLRRRAARMLRQRGDLRLDGADPERALRWYRLGGRLEPESLTSQRRVADAAGLCGDLDGAERAWQRAAAADPDHPEPAIRLAFLAAWAGRLDEARDLAQRCLRLDPERRSRNQRGARAESLLRHLECAPASTTRHPHAVICGVSYCGSTLLAHLLGLLPGVANAGETYWLVHRANPGPEGPAALRIDFEAPGPVAHPHCPACGGPCLRLDLARRSELAADPVDWFDRIADALGEPTLVSSDKTYHMLLSLDPWLRFDAIVLFRPPLQAWASTRGKPSNRQDVRQYLRSWDRAYRSLTHAFPVRGRKVFVDFEQLRLGLPASLEALCRALELPWDADAVADMRRPQHAFGGNQRLHESLRAPGPVRIVRRDPVDVPAEERRLIERYEARSPILAELRAQHASTFGSN